MNIDADFMHTLSNKPADEVWQIITKYMIDITSKSLPRENAFIEVEKRESEIDYMDYFLSSIAWDLWIDFGKYVERTSDRLARWWTESYDAKAILILDGLSLRELPWILCGAKDRKFTIHSTHIGASEIPGDTNEFAKALGFGTRSRLQSNNGRSSRFKSARTESIDIPWKDCENMIDSARNWIFWHHWPDKKIHDYDAPGQGLRSLTRDVVDNLTSEDFWSFISRLATNRRLIITSDHGYAASGLFHDSEAEPAKFLKNTFGGCRNVKGVDDIGPFIPPVALDINGPHGLHRLALGRRKWKVQGGYPTLTHGGLSLLEVLSPIVEISSN